jgi:hypothetical protein
MKEMLKKRILFAYLALGTFADLKMGKILIKLLIIDRIFRSQKS